MSGARKREEDSASDESPASKRLKPSQDPSHPDQVREPFRVCLISPVPTTQTTGQGTARPKVQGNC